MVVLMVAIECSVARNWLELTDPVSLSWRYSALAAQSNVRDRDLLFFGDSLIKHALIPSVVKEASGQRAENLGAARCPTLMSHFLLRRSLEGGARPRAIIFNAKPAVLIGGVDFTQRYWEEALTARELLLLFALTRRSEFVASTLAARVLPSLRSRLEIRAHLAAACLGQAGPLHEINRALWRNWTINDGANVVFPHSPYHGNLTAKDVDNLHPNVFYADKTNVLGIDWLLTAAEKQRIPVFWLLPPLSPNLQSAREESGAERGYESFIRGYQLRYPRTLSVLDGRKAGYPAKVFTDATHLNAVGAISVSRAVARLFMQEDGHLVAKAGPRWITLEPWSDHSAAIMPQLEDVETSQAKVRREYVGD
jgi:hypothetical protein